MSRLVQRLRPALSGVRFGVGVTLSLVVGAVALAPGAPVGAQPGPAHTITVSSVTEPAGAGGPFTARVQRCAGDPVMSAVEGYCDGSWVDALDLVLGADGGSARMLGATPGALYRVSQIWPVTSGAERYGLTSATCHGGLWGVSDLGAAYVQLGPGPHSSAVCTLGATRLPRAAANPDLGGRCGTDLVVVLDESASNGAHRDEMVAAARTLVRGVSGTGARAAVVSFAAHATLQVGPVEVTPETLGSRFEPALALYRPAGPRNWEAALSAAAGLADQLDGPLVVLITDGPPTARLLDGSGAEHHDLFAPSLVGAIGAADTLYGTGAHLLVAAVGEAATEPHLLDRVSAVVGVEELLADAANVATADVLLAGEPTHLAERLQALPRALCAPSLTITGHEVGAAGDPEVVRPAAGWSFEVTAEVPGGSLGRAPDGPRVSGPTTTTVHTDGDGRAHVAWDLSSGSAISVRVTTVPGGGGDHLLGRVLCHLNGFDGGAVVLVHDALVTGGDRATTVNLELRREQAVACSYHAFYDPRHLDSPAATVGADPAVSTDRDPPPGATVVSVEEVASGEETVPGPVAGPSGGHTRGSVVDTGGASELGPATAPQATGSPSTSAALGPLPSSHPVPASVTPVPDSSPEVLGVAVESRPPDAGPVQPAAALVGIAAVAALGLGRRFAGAGRIGRGTPSAAPRRTTVVADDGTPGSVLAPEKASR